MQAELTPCGALFETMKRYGGISHKDLARLVLSGRPLADGKSPLSRSDDRTWVSRFIVHAPVGSLQDRYFSDWGVAALRVCARLRSKDGKCLSAREVLDMICGPGGELMRQALRACHQDLSLYDNVQERLVAGSGYSEEERAELACVLFVSAGCSANVKRSCAYVLDYVRSVHGGRLETVPAAVMETGAGAQPAADPRSQAQALGLLRVVNGLVSGSLHWVQPLSDGIEIGALALGSNDIADVEPDVSGHHLRVWCNEQGALCVEGLGSSNGTVLISGADGSHTVVEPPRGAADGRAPEPVEVHAGDELVLGASTRFMLLEGIPESWE